MGGLIQWLSLIRDNRLSSGETLPRNVKPTLNTWVCEAQGRVCLTAIVCRLRRYSTRRSNSRAETSGELLSYSALATQSSHGFRFMLITVAISLHLFPGTAEHKDWLWGGSDKGQASQGIHFETNSNWLIPINSNPVSMMALRYVPSSCSNYSRSICYTVFFTMISNS